MAEQEIPERVRRFVVQHVTSLAQLEVLLLLYAQPKRTWDATAVARELGIDTTWAAEQLTELQRLGLSGAGPQPGQFVFWPATPELAALIDELATAYAQRRVTLVTLIFSKPMDKVRTFADAFRIRAEPPPDSSASNPPPPDQTDRRDESEPDRDTTAGGGHG